VTPNAANTCWSSSSRPISTPVAAPSCGRGHLRRRAQIADILTAASFPADPWINLAGRSTSEVAASLGVNPNTIGTYTGAGGCGRNGAVLLRGRCLASLLLGLLRSRVSELQEVSDGQCREHRARPTRDARRKDEPVGQGSGDPLTKAEGARRQLPNRLAHPSAAHALGELGLA